MPNTEILTKLLLVSAAATLSVETLAQEDAAEEVVEELIVVGSQIRGADVQGTLPVSVLNVADIEATGALSGQELLRMIPQIGETNFNESVTTGVNAARGDVGSINLRGLGTGNTLVLINGRRMVLHPGTQTESFVPVVTANSNTLPVRALARVEVLRDGASAIYGTDAVAGVVNYVMRDDYEGFELNANYGNESDTGMSQFVIDGAAGFNFNGGASNLTITGSFATRDGIMASEKSFAADADLRPRVAGDPLFEGDTQLDGRSTATQWGQFQYDGDIGRLHIRPRSLVRDNGSTLEEADCSFLLNDENICLDGGSGDRALRLNRNAARTLISDRDRTNLFAFFNHEFDNSVELFAEAGYYHAKTNRVWEAASNLSNGRFEVPADYYWNPLGPVTFDDGRVNPNRLPGLDPAVVPVEGVGFQLRSFRPLDTGPRQVEVTNQSVRLLAGLRGSFGSDWDWETAVLYSEADTEDRTNNRLSSTLFQQQLLLDTPDAYNVFTGGDINNVTAPVAPNPNPQSAIDPMRITVNRNSETSITLADFKVSNPALFSLPGGEAGIGLGIEFREEDFTEDRDPRSDGTISFTDAITGELVNVSDMVGSSASPDATGSRDVTSAYVEFLLPLLADLPAVQSLDMQLAARYEDFSDVGSITKPRVAVSWFPIQSLQIRAAYSEGFRAPNLVQIHQGALSVVNTRLDPALTDPVTGDVPSYQIQEIRVGNADLEPEESENRSIGLVWSATDNFFVTLDFWNIEQDGVVGIFGGQNHLLLDNVLRQQGSSSPFVEREATNDGSLGQVNVVFDRYLNFQPREIEGYDFSINWAIDVGASNFDLKFNAARLTKFNQQAGPFQQILIDAGEPVQNVGDLVQQEFRPEWRSTFLATWMMNQWGAGLSANYVGEVFDIQTVADSDTDNPDAPLPVDSLLRVNAHVDYRLESDFADTRLRLGVRNLFDEDPPLADEAFGYEGALHSWMGRYLYVDVNVRF